MHLLGVFAHPDDETYSMAGCMARYTAEGVGATILTFTRGEAGQITPGSGATRETLAGVREAELRAACALVGCTDVRIVGTADGETVDDDAGVAAIVEVIKDVRPEVVVTMEPEGITSHPDHKAVSVMTMRAVESPECAGIVKRLFLSALPQSALDEWERLAAEAGTQIAAPDDPLAPRGADDATIACVVDAGDLAERKLQALWAHKTQSQEFVASMPPDVVRLAMRIESFQRAIPPYVAGDPVGDDLFEGLR